MSALQSAVLFRVFVKEIILRHLELYVLESRPSPYTPSL